MNTYRRFSLAAFLCVMVCGSAAAEHDMPAGVGSSQAVAAYHAFGRGQTPFDAVVTREGDVVVLGSGGLVAVLSKDLREVTRRIEVDPAANFLAAAVGPDEHIRLTDSAGSIWRLDRKLERVTVEFDEPVGALFSISYLADGSGVAVGEFGTVLMRTPNSDRWQSVTFDWSAELPRLTELAGDISPHLYRVCPSPGGGALVVGEYGVVVQLMHGVWQVQQPGGDNATLFACLATERGQMAVAGQSGLLLISDTARSAWRRVDSGLTTDIYELAHYAGQLLAVAQDRLAHGPLDAARLVKAETILPSAPWVARVLPVRERLLLVGRPGYLVIDDARRLVRSGPDARMASSSQHASR